MKNPMSFKANLRNIASKYKIPAQAVLQNYMLEKLLERISESVYKNAFILKGGLLIASLVGIHSRTTMDMDTTIRDYPLSEQFIKKAINDICSIDLHDGIFFTFLNISQIREDDIYGGYRASISACFESINTPIKIDITTGDAVTPQPIKYNYRSSFENKRFQIMSYNTETILAEKIETILRRGTLNTRPRDFYDVYILEKTKQDLIDIRILNQALLATTIRRKPQLILLEKTAIIQTIQNDPIMIERWERYCKDHYNAKGISFDTVITSLQTLLTKNNF